MTVEVTRLANGLTVASDSMAEAQSVSLGVWIGVGTRHETPQTNGVAHLLEHMLFKGTPSRSAQDIAEQIEAVGGHLNAYTGREITAYHAKVLTEDLPLGLELIADILQNSLFEDAELERERQVVLQEIGQAADTPDDIIFDHFQETAFPDQGVGRPVLGRPDIVARLDREAVRGFQQANYGGDCIVLAAAGAVEHARLVDLAERHFSGLQRESRAAIDQPHYRGGDYREARELEQVHLILGFDGIGFRDSDYHACAAFSTAFGGGMSSRLFQELRERRGLVYSVFSFAAAQVDSGIFGVYAGTGEREARELLPVLCDEWQRVAEEGLSDAELARAKAQLRASIAMGRERNENRVEHLANQILVHGRPLSAEEILAKVEAVDQADISRVARRLLASRPTLVALGPLSGVESFEQVCERFAAPQAARAAV
ncbi:M16 family metallopeptidase [Aquibaculum sediminis]|uniref:M16 family metallopeptidase n=1 Tax=Aquibaculum sediminis TaxID=3231907 RepID=UPI003452B151